MLRNSKTMYSISSVCTTSRSWTTFGCSNSFKTLISRIAVLGTPSDSLEKMEKEKEMKIDSDREKCLGGK